MTIILQFHPITVTVAKGLINKLSVSSIKMLIRNLTSATLAVEKSSRSCDTAKQRIDTDQQPLQSKYTSDLYIL